MFALCPLLPPLATELASGMPTLASTFFRKVPRPNARVRRPPRLRCGFPSRARRARSDSLPWRAAAARIHGAAAHASVLPAVLLSSHKVDIPSYCFPRARRRPAISGADGVILRCLCAAPVRLHCLSSCLHADGRRSALLTCCVLCLSCVRGWGRARVPHECRHSTGALTHHLSLRVLARRSIKHHGCYGCCYV